MIVTFYKYHGTGNDFILIDNRNSHIKLTQKLIQSLCDRHFGIGADGLILLEKDKTGYKMRYYNADGIESTLCGNGGRCFTAFALRIGLVHKGDKFTFTAVDGQHFGSILPKKETPDNPFVSLQFNNAKLHEANDTHIYINTGSPHWVEYCDDVNAVDLIKQAHAVRYSEKFKKHGININFIQQTKNDSIKIRTYERGVENETLSCGTGAVAAAIAAYKKWNFTPQHIETKGGSLYVSFKEISNGIFENIWLSGPTKFVFNGEINLPSGT